MADNENSILTPDAMVAQLRAMRQQIPHYSQLTPAQTRQIAAAGSVPPEMIVAASNAIGESPAVQGAVGVTIEQIRQETSDANAWATLEEELTAMLRGVTAANRIRRHRLGTIALQTYSITRTLAKRPEYADLLPHRDALRRTNRFGKARKSETPTAPAPEPVPQQTPDSVTS